MPELESIVVNYIVRVTGADAAGRVKKLDEDLRRSAKQTGAELENESKSQDKLNRSVDDHIKTLRKEIDARKERQTLTVRDVKELNSMQRELKSLERVSTDNDRSFRRFSRTLGDGESSLAKFNRASTFFRNTWGAIKIPAIVAGIGTLTAGIGALAGGAIALTGAITPLAGAITALPSGIGALVQGIGTVKLAFKGLDDALKNMDDPEKWAESMKKLTPAAREFAQQIKSMQPIFKDLRREAGAELFPQLTASLQRIARSNLFQIIGKNLRETGRVIGELADRFSRRLVSPEWSRDIDTLMQRNTRTLHQFGLAAIDLAEAFKDIMIEARPLTEFLGDSARRIAAGIKDWAQAGRESGELERMFSRTRDSLQAIGSLLGNTARGFVALTKAARPLGMDILRALNEEAGKWQRWANSISGQAALRQYFEGLRDPLWEAGRLVRDLTRAFVDLSKDPNLTPLIRAIRTELLPAFVEMTQTASQKLLPTLIDLGVEVGRWLGVIVGASSPLTEFLRFLTRILRGANDLIDRFPILGDIIVTAFGALSVAKITGLLNPFGRLIGLVGQLAGFAGKLRGFSLAALLGGGGAAAGVSSLFSRGGRIGANLPSLARGVQPVYVVNFPPALGGVGVGGRAAAAGTTLTTVGAPAGRGGRILGGARRIGGKLIRVVPVIGLGFVAEEILDMVEPDLRNVRPRPVGGRRTLLPVGQNAAGQDIIARGLGRAAGIGGPGGPRAYGGGQPQAGRGPTWPTGVAAWGADPRAIGNATRAYMAQTQQVRTLVTEMGRLRDAARAANSAQEVAAGTEQLRNQTELDMLNARQALEDFQRDKKRLVEEGLLTQRQANAQERVLQDQLTNARRTYKQAVQESQRAQEQAAAAANREAEAQRRAKEAHDAAMRSINQQISSTRNLSGSSQNAAARAQTLASNLYRQADALRTSDRRASDYARAVADLTTKLGRLPTKKEIRIEMNDRDVNERARRLRQNLERIFGRPINQQIIQQVVTQYQTGAGGSPSGSTPTSTAGCTPSLRKYCKSVGMVCRNGACFSAAKGGVVGGPVGAGDSIPARLSPGEVVLTDHGQRLIEQGASLSEALLQQRPHGGTSPMASVHEVIEPDMLAGALGLATGTGPAEIKRLQGLIATLRGQLQRTPPKQKGKRTALRNRIGGLLKRIANIRQRMGRRPGAPPRRGRRQVPVTNFRPGSRLNNQQLLDVLYNAGFRGQALWRMLAIVKGESGGWSGARNLEGPDRSYGLFQINKIGGQHAGISVADAMDPEKSAEYAFRLWKSEGFRPWSASGYSAFEHPQHAKFMDTAQSAWERWKDRREPVPPREDRAPPGTTPGQVASALQSVAPMSRFGAGLEIRVDPETGARTIITAGGSEHDVASAREEGWVIGRRVACPPGTFPWGGQCWGKGDGDAFASWFKEHGAPRLVNKFQEKHPQLAAIIGSLPTIARRPRGDPRPPGEPGKTSSGAFRWFKQKFGEGDWRTFLDAASRAGRDIGWLEAWIKKHPKQAKFLGLERGMSKQVMLAQAFANQLDAAGTSYVYGAGHTSGGSWDYNGPYDCSSFVSTVLHRGLGLFDRTYYSSDFYPGGSAGMQAGRGRNITIWTRGTAGRDGHVMIEINGIMYENGRRTSDSSAGFTASHPQGYQEGGFVSGDPRGRGRAGRWSRGTDTVPALLTPGELVLNESQQKRLAAIIDWLSQSAGFKMGNRIIAGSKARMQYALAQMLLGRGESFLSDAQKKKLTDFLGQFGSPGWAGSNQPSPRQLNKVWELLFGSGRATGPLSSVAKRLLERGAGIQGKSLSDLQGKDLADRLAQLTGAPTSAQTKPRRLAGTPFNVPFFGGGSVFHLASGGVPTASEFQTLKEYAPKAAAQRPQWVKNLFDVTTNFRSAVPGWQNLSYSEALRRYQGEAAVLAPSGSVGPAAQQPGAGPGGGGITTAGGKKPPPGANCTPISANARCGSKGQRYCRTHGFKMVRGKRVATRGGCKCCKVPPNDGSAPAGDPTGDPCTDCYVLGDEAACIACDEMSGFGEEFGGGFEDMGGGDFGGGFGDFGGGFADTPIVAEQPSVAQKIAEFLRPGEYERGIRGILYERLGLEQQLKKTFETPEAAKARSEFITKQIIPALERELKDLRKALTMTGGDAEARRSVEEGIARKQNEILQAQLEAMQQIEENTSEMSALFRVGAVSFSFGGQTFMNDLGFGVGT